MLKQPLLLFNAAKTLCQIEYSFYLYISFIYLKAHLLWLCMFKCFQLLRYRILSMTDCTINISTL